jgi:hypothetical protein
VGKSSTVRTTVTTAMLGKAPVVGGNGGRRARFSVWDEFERRKKKSRPGLIVGLKYGGVMRLVTNSGEERLPATRRSRARLRAVDHAEEEGEDDPLL